MAKLSARSMKKSATSNSFRFVVEKLIHKSLLMGSNNKKSSSCNDCVPEDVKEGHFAVIAEGGGDDEEAPKRLVMPLSCLRNPAFLRLLEQAEEEYGFDHEGALTIPCTPSQLQRILLLEQQQTTNNNNNHLFNFSTNHLQFIIS
ncbi:hypothetical protein HN51_042982 [Arachis hypogaea]|uniref:Auxin-induced protein n=1 Tax=Arachis hypogaea TaxID=3818 RepID=A0A444Y7Y7_ARAHY|nr:auxin-responsive protein SAUR50 [Arachis ipaensis]XP_025672146.1 auxin-responsive protein SAUR50 [Arachis hypogaea]QHN95092.1 uncharacterized protein DS421_18g606560 [Arachis hypogaea]RYQ97956.1 hypothetical protein Ahy_B08g094030 [Arachis hypogaea]